MKIKEEQKKGYLTFQQKSQALVRNKDSKGLFSDEEDSEDLFSSQSASKLKVRLSS